MTQHDTLTLEPCPHCGKYHTPKIVLASEHWADEYDGDYLHSERYAVMCDASSPNGPGGCGASGGFYATEGEAVAAWNRRAALSATQPAQAAQSAPVGYAGYTSVQGFTAAFFPAEKIPEGTPLYIALLPAAGADVQLLDAMERHRIAVVPEFEGTWDASVYGEEGEPQFIGSGDTPRDAIRAAIAASGRQE